MAIIYYIKGLLFTLPALFTVYLVEIAAQQQPEQDTSTGILPYTPHLEWHRRWRCTQTPANPEVKRGWGGLTYPVCVQVPLVTQSRTTGGQWKWSARGSEPTQTPTAALQASMLTIVPTQDHHTHGKLRISPQNLWFTEAANLLQFCRLSVNSHFESAQYLVRSLISFKWPPKHLLGSSSLSEW